MSPAVGIIVRLVLKRTVRAVFEPDGHFPFGREISPAVGIVVRLILERTVRAAFEPDGHVPFGREISRPSESLYV